MRIFPLGQDRYSRQYWNLPELGGVLIEGIQTATFDALEKYISEVTYKREMEMIQDKLYQNNTEGTDRKGDVSFSRETSQVPGYGGHMSPIMKQLESDPSSAQQSDSEMDSRTTLFGVDTPTSEFTPNPSPPPPPLTLTDSHESSTTLSNHPLEKQQFANRNKDIHSYKNKKTDSSPSNIHKKVHKTTTTTTSNHSLQLTENINKNVEKSFPWFSILPRKQCEVLHYLQLDTLQQQQQQQQHKQGLMAAAPQFLGGSGYSYMTPEGTILNQPLVHQQVQMGYAMVGNNLVQVPQTQYVLGQTGQTGGTTAATINGNQQLISLGNGQYVLAPAAAASNNIQYVSINGNQYAIMPAPEQQQQQDIQCNGSDSLSIVQENNALSMMTQVQSSVGAVLNHNSGATKETRRERKEKKQEKLSNTTTCKSVSVYCRNILNCK